MGKNSVIGCDFVTATIRDVAILAGLSLGTVSKYINGGSVKEENKNKIEQAIEQLGFRQNYIAKGLRKAQTFTIGVLVPMLSSSFSSRIISAIEEYLLPFGYCVIVSECHDSPETEIRKTRFLLERMVDGIVMLPYSQNGFQVDILEDSGKPFIVIDQMISSHKTDSVVLDNADATRIPTERLIEYGHKEIAFLSGNPDLFTSQGRISGYKDALLKHGLPFNPAMLLNGNYSIEGAYRSVINLYQEQLKPTALVASNYEMSLGAILALNQLGKKIPEDISVIGFDNLPLSEITSPPLSIMSQPMQDMGYDAARILYQRIQGDYSTFPEVSVFNASLLNKKSVARI
ncbi:MAG: LacI family transcriptional regulator [Clostridiales bacterium]|nr:LacI family transcriptional regulator [Clostridiales bacterium]